MNKPMVLIAEDEPTIRNFLCKGLEDHYRLHFAYNGSEAIRFLKGNGVDVLVLDIVMPVMNGIEVLYWIKENEIDIPVIPMAAFDIRTLLHPFEGLRIVPGLAKPFAMDELQRCVEMALQVESPLRRTAPAGERRLWERRRVRERRMRERRSRFHIDPFLISDRIAWRRRGLDRRRRERRSGFDRRVN